jgi:hypothetical protein
MFHYICTAIVLYFFLSLVWPGLRKTKTAGGRNHRQVLESTAKLEHQSAPLATRPAPTFNSAERARVLALGRIRDGAKRHPVLDSPYNSVAKPHTAQT